MSNSSSSLLETLLLLSNQIGEAISKAHYTPQEGLEISIKSTLFSLLPNSSSISQNQLKFKIVDFSLCCAALASASSASYSQLCWVPNSLSEKAVLAFKKLSDAYFSVFQENCFVGFGEFGVLGNEKKLVIELLPKVLILIKQKIKESSIDTSDDADRISAASARVPVAFAILAAYQFKWFITQIDYPFLGKLCNLIIPCGLTALDHWSPEVKGQGMVSFIHLAKNVNAAEIGVYEDVILDACCQSIAVSDEIWDLAVEMSVLMATSTQRSDPRSEWYEKLLNEMLSHLERQPRDKSRRIAWLKNIEPLLNVIGLVLLAHFRRIFPLFFQWMHADDDDTVLLVRSHHIL
ncbi:hypothetical protein Leryth_008608 [Lithospermum erythrorhizon]|nr:hypothetical protein Leryth_008608 [Lithospermum erythrorhizon]